MMGLVRHAGSEIREKFGQNSPRGPKMVRTARPKSGYFSSLIFVPIFRGVPYVPSNSCIWTLFPQKSDFVGTLLVSDTFFSQFWQNSDFFLHTYRLLLQSSPSLSLAFLRFPRFPLFSLSLAFLRFPLLSFVFPIFFRFPRFPLFSPFSPRFPSMSPILSFFLSSTLS